MAFNTDARAPPGIFSKTDCCLQAKISPRHSKPDFCRRFFSSHASAIHARVPPRILPNTDCCLQPMALQRHPKKHHLPPIAAWIDFLGRRRPPTGPKWAPKNISLKNPFYSLFSTAEVLIARDKYLPGIKYLFRAGSTYGLFMVCSLGSWFLVETAVSGRTR